MIESRDKVELALRSANAAKRALELMDAQSVIVAKSYVEQLAKAVMELDKFVERLGAKP